MKTNRGLFSLESLTSITDLSLTGSDEVTDEGLSTLEHLSKLKSLRLSGYLQVGRPWLLPASGSSLVCFVIG